MDKIQDRIKRAEQLVAESGPLLKISQVSGDKGNGKLVKTRKAYELEFGVATTIAAFNLPAGKPEGRTLGSCPGAGECDDWCYAMSHRYLFENVDFLRRVNRASVDTLLGGGQSTLTDAFRDAVLSWMASVQGRAQTERRFLLRLHDSGDFFSPLYGAAWAEAFQKLNHLIQLLWGESVELLPYAYTKSYHFKDMVNQLRGSGVSVVQSLESKHPEMVDWDYPVATTLPPGVDVPIGWVDGNTDEFADLPAVLGNARIALPHHGVRGRSKVNNQLIEIIDSTAA